VAASFIFDNAIDIVDHPGWKTQYELITPNITLKYDEDIFFGVGNCPYQTLRPEDLERAQDEDEVIDFYMGLLRTYCQANQKKYIKKLIQTGYLEIKENLLQVVKTNKIL